MSKTLSTFMTVALTILVLSTLIIGKCYQELKNSNNDYHTKLSNYQIQPK